MCSVIVQLVLVPVARPALVQVTVPVARAQPVLADTKVVPAGTASVTVKPALSDGPRVVTLTVMLVSVPATEVPAVAVAGAVLVTSRSALVVTVSVSVAESLPGVGSAVGLLVMEAVLATLAEA